MTNNIPSITTFRITPITITFIFIKEIIIINLTSFTIIQIFFIALFISIMTGIVLIIVLIFFISTVLFI